MKPYFAILCLAALALASAADAQSPKGVVPPPWELFKPQYDKSTDGGSGRIYTVPDAGATGGIEGKVEDVELGMCIAIESPAIAADPERIRVYRAVPEIGGDDKKTVSTFKFTGLPTGKYDLVLIDRTRHMWEGIQLGEDSASKFSTAQRTNLTTRINVADTYWNQRVIHRIGVDGERALLLVERLRVGLILKQSGEKFGGYQRRLEIAELHQAADDWQMVRTRHFYRLGEPAETYTPFLRDIHVPALGGIRVVDGVKQLGTLDLKVAK
jgi:hypothetical protein